MKDFLTFIYLDTAIAY